MRAGDIRNSAGAAQAARKELGFKSRIKISDGFAAFFREEKAVAGACKPAWPKLVSEGDLLRGEPDQLPKPVKRGARRAVVHQA